jgi:two-component system response regulator
MKSAFEILVAEDNPDDVFLLRRTVTKASLLSRVHAVPDGVETLEYLSGRGVYQDREKYPFPDVVLLDLNMPKLNGFEVLEIMRHDPRVSRLVVFVLSASVRQSDVDRIYALGANGYVVKPTRVDELSRFVTALHQWLEFMALPSLGQPSSSLAPNLIEWRLPQRERPSPGTPCLSAS